MKTYRFFFAFCLLVFLSCGFVYGQGYGQASYAGLADNAFMKSWLVIGPVDYSPGNNIPEESIQRAAFDRNELTRVAVKGSKLPASVKINGVDYPLKALTTESNIVDFIPVFGQHNYSKAYALAEITMAVPGKILAGAGSDDDIKVFLNGKLVHSNWTARGTTPDDDVFMLDLQKGTNQLLVEVQNIEGGWSFSMRKISKDIMNDRLVKAAGLGNMDDAVLLLDNGADIEAKNISGLTPYLSASLQGRQAMMDFLKGKGAKTDLQMPSVSQMVDPLFASFKNGESAGMAVLIAKNGQILYQQGFGYSDVGNKVAVTPETKFRIGSITKQFTATAILKLMEEGKISLEDKISKFIPDFPRGEEVTIRQLLNHTSGIHPFTANPSFLKYVNIPVTSQSVVDTIKAHPFDFNPGDRYSYNNSGFFLLGYIIEKVSGKNLADYLQETIFTPLGMTNTGIHSGKAVLTHEAYGYDSDNGKICKALNWDMSWAGGAGALYSTVDDLYKWNEALFNGKVISAESMKAAFTPTLLNSGEKVPYGFGWQLDDNRGYHFISHGGGLQGFLSYILRQPDQNLTVVVLCNTTQPPAGMNPATVAYTLAEFCLWQGMDKQSGVSSGLKIDEKILEKYTGRYNYGQGMILIVTREGDQLYAQMTAQPKYPIYPSSENQFSWKIVDANIRFITDSAGNVTGGVHHQNGRDLEVKKLKEETEISVDPAILDAYVGKYDDGNGLVITVTKEDNKLFMQAATLPKYQLHAASETEFFTLEISVRFVFNKNDQGQTDQVTVDFDRQKIVAKKLTTITKSEQ